MRPKNDPYEIWRTSDFQPATPDTPCIGWEWRVLKKYQTPEKEAANPYARWFCFVTSEFCPQGELGDTYIGDIKNSAELVGPDTVVVSEHPTYRELLNAMKILTPEQLDMNVTVYIRGVDEFYPIQSFGVTPGNLPADVLDPNHPYLLV